MYQQSGLLRKSLQRRIDALVVPRGLRDLIREIRARNMTYLSEAKLNRIARLALRGERQRIPGLVIETGCALGGSGVLLAATKSPERPLKIFDVFGMIPPPSEKDGYDVKERYRAISSGSSSGINGEMYYGYRRELDKVVEGNFETLGYPVEEHKVELIKGLIQETLSIDEPVSLAHVDVDWYQSVRVSLERIVPRLSVGGAIVVDDYFDWSGCRQAVDDYFADLRASFAFDDTAGSLVIIRNRSEVEPS